MRFSNSLVIKNFFYLFINHFFNLIIPLLIFPFLVKTLGISYFGLYSLAYAGVIFCFMFCDYGFNFSGSKYISINRLNIEKRNEAFSAILSIKLLIAALVSIVWIVYIETNSKFENSTVFGILFVGMIFGNAINIQWFFQGLEELGVFSIINSIIKLLSNLAVLFLIKSPQDVYLLPLIYSTAFLLSGVISIFLATKVAKVKIKLFEFIHFPKFLKSGFDYFITIGTTSLIFNGTIIIVSFFEHDILILGVFSTLDRIIKILVSMYVPFSNAIYPRNMANFAQGKQKGMASVVKYGSIALFCSIGCIFLIQIFSQTILSYIDPNLISYANWLRIFSIWLFFIILNNLIGYHFLNGLNRSSNFRNITILSAIITLVLIFLGCFFFSYKGCIIAVIAGEIILSFMLIYVNRKEKKEFLKVIFKGE